ncbi:glycosyltransferase [Pseudomonas fluorescens group sp. PF-1]
MNSKSALLIVEKNFNEIHVGVRRVIHYYWQLLIREGYNITLAAPINGKLSSCSQPIADALMRKEEFSSDKPKPTWTSNSLSFEIENEKTASSIQNHTHNIWNSDQNISPKKYSISIITNPWMCSDVDGPPKEKYSIGIVYDMVPNLLSIGALRMPRLLNTYEFAHKHSAGYDFYLENVQNIVCISESTKRDFLSFYGKRTDTHVTASIPFKDFGDGVIKGSTSNTVLLLNALDYRKNFTAAVAAIKIASKKIPLNLIVVGKERMPIKDVEEFLKEISSTCEAVEWFRSPNDLQLEELMSRSKILFFPSFYEGLGLPILEAQAKGLPVISSNSSSCKEINLNQNLTADPYDHTKFANLLESVINGTETILTGELLRSAQIDYLSAHTNLKAL